MKVIAVDVNGNSLRMVTRTVKGNYNPNWYQSLYFRQRACRYFKVTSPMMLIAVLMMHCQVSKLSIFPVFCHKLLSSTDAIVANAVFDYYNI